MPLLCRDCKHALRQWHDFGKFEFAKCAATTARGALDLVTGKMIPDKMYFCSTMRKFDCGEDGKLWEPR